MSHVKKEFAAKLDSLSRENTTLKARLDEAGISLEDVILSPKLTSSPAKASSSSFKGNSNGESELLGKRSFHSEMLVVAKSSHESTSFQLSSTWSRLMDNGSWNPSLDAFMGKFGPGQDPGAGNPKASIMTNAADIGKVAEKSCTGFVIYPNSNFRLYWDLTGLLLISYDLVSIPFNQAFKPAPSVFSRTMDWVTLVFWTGDMLQGFFLGYFEKGQYISSSKKILRHYVSTWFFIDILVVGPDWLVMIASSIFGGDSAGVGQVGKILKGARAIRVLRLLRLLKLQRIINLMYDMIQNEHTFICLNLVKLLVSVLVLNHVIACVWYLIGRLSLESDLRNWIQVGHVDEEELAYRYLTSLHWSLTQFTPASMDISARNLWERLFSIIVLFFAMVAFSSIVGSITGFMTSLRNLKNEEMKQFWLLRRYLNQREVSSELSNRIFKYLEYCFQKQGKLVQAKHVVILAGLSESLQNELFHQMHAPHLVQHPFFWCLDTDMNVVMQRLCSTCLKQHSYAEKELVFSAGEAAQKMFFVKGGNLEYTKMDLAKLHPPPQPKEWIGEPVLWTTWRHRGDLVSASTSDLIALNPSQFVEVMSVHPRPWYYATHYARKFLTFLNGIPERQLTDSLRNPEFYEDAATSSDMTKTGGIFPMGMGNGMHGEDDHEDSASGMDDNSMELQAEAKDLGMAEPRKQERQRADAQPRVSSVARRVFTNLCPCNSQLVS